MLAYTNLEDSKMDEKPPAEWRRGPNTRNQSQGVKSIGDGKTPNSDNLQPQPSTFLDTNSSLKRSDIQDHIKSVKQQNR